MDNQDEGIFYFSSSTLHQCTSESDSSSVSFDAPPFSPVMSASSLCEASSLSESSLLLNEELVNSEDDDGEPAHDDGEPAHGDQEPAHGDQEPAHGDCGEISQESAPIEDLSAASINISDQCTDFPLLPLIRWLGFKIVIDNIDKNLRPSYQRCDNKTISMHACNMYACLDQINFSSLL